MSPLSPSTLFLVVAALSWLLGFPLRRALARAGVMDHPRDYSSHSIPIPRGGGLLVVVAFFAWFLFAPHESMPGINWLAAGVASVALVSFLDDVRPRSRRLRFAVYTIGAAIFVSRILECDVVGTWGPTWLIAFVLWLWVAGYSNAFNFIDGIDGLAGTQAIGALAFGVGLCLLAPAGQVPVPAEGFEKGAWFPGHTEAVMNLALLQVILAGAMAGFLCHNLPEARLFLGDVGSIATGFLLSAIAVIGGVELGWKTGVALAALHLGPVLDTGLTLARRLARGERIVDRHREFFFHRAVRSGRSHPFVTWSELAIQALAGILLLSTLGRWTDSAIALFVVVGVIGLAWLAFFAWCEVQFRKRADGEEGAP